MTEIHNEINTSTENKATAHAILVRIENESIRPYTKWYFITTKWGIWILWLLSILFGALALAVTMYAAMSANYALYEATHENFFTFCMSVLPFVWMALFLVMVYVAAVELRNTKHGYRYSLLQVVVSSLSFSFLAGMFFHMVGFGFALDHTLGRQISAYMSLEKFEQKTWQAPASGRLVGSLEFDEANVPLLQSDAVLNFRDTEGVVWRLSNNELNSREFDLLRSGQQVRLLGTTTSSVTFHVCGVFPWMFNKAMGRKEMEQEREEFDTIMHSHLRMLQRGSALSDEKMPFEDNPDRLCAHLEMMKRMQD